MSNEQSRRHVIVTGGGQGLGLAITQGFLDDGANVTVIDWSSEPSADFVEVEGASVGRLHYSRADVSDETQLAAALRESTDAFGRLDVLVNNAGISQMKTPIVETDVETFDRVVAIDMRGVFLGIKHAAPLIIGSGGGAIVNISSMMGLVSQAGVGAYAAAKHGVIGLTKTAALELGPQGVRVNAVCPGRHDTPMVAAWRPADADTNVEYQEEVRRNNPATHRVGRPEEIAAAVFFLASAGASNVHGVSLPVDGGWSAV
jgi:NAD(P)-dependent dehydrogenase (short-subunit alcohol dehydrogenase family)